MRGELVAGGLDHCVDECDGQADHVEVAADDAGNPAAGVALDGVGTGLVHGLASGDVGEDFFVGQGEHGDAGGFRGHFDTERLR